MTRTLFLLAAAASITAGAHMAAQNPPAAAPGQGRGAAAPPPQMSFFVTSVGIGNGANLGGLAGADAHCQKLAADSGRDGAAGKTWHAYLSTQGPNAVNARDRIGNGPWANARGAEESRRTWATCTATRSIRRGSATTSRARPC